MAGCFPAHRNRLKEVLRSKKARFQPVRNGKPLARKIERGFPAKGLMIIPVNQTEYAVSPWAVVSSPSNSSASVTRRPTVTLAAIRPIKAATPLQRTVTITLLNWAKTWLPPKAPKLLPGEKPR